jgi:hypothetical protein
MILEEMQTLPEAEVAALDPVRVEHHVQATGWKRDPHLGRGKVLVYERPESRLDQIRIPVSRQLSDFNLVMAQTVTLIAQYEKRPALELLHELLLPPADYLCFTESGPAVGTIDLPFEHGLNLLAGVRRVLLAAVCSVLRPEPFHSHTTLADAQTFLQHCRLVQVERGHFTLTIACPLDATPTRDVPTEQIPLTRRVTVLLMRSLDRLAQAFDTGDSSLALASVNGEPVLTASLCEGLLDMTPEGEGSSLTVTANWARTLPPPAGMPLPMSVRLRREDFPSIEALARQLQPVHEPPPEAAIR